MANLVSGFEHRDAEKKKDETLRDEARAHLSKRPELQLVAELVAKLRTLALPWWTPAMQRERWNAETRLGWLRQRPDVRQQITVGLTGLAPKAARRQKPNFQAALIDSVLDEGDVTVASFDAAFEPADLVVYGSALDFWREFRERMPWNDDSVLHQDLIAWLLHALLTDRSAVDGLRRTPIMTPWDVRTRIDGRVWHTHIPLDVRVSIDEARFAREKGEPTRPFHAKDDLIVAMPEIITKSIPLRDLMEVFLAAESAIGFDPTPPEADKRAVPEVVAAPSPAASAAPPAASAAPPAASVAPPAATLPPEAPASVDAVEPATKRKRELMPTPSYRPAAADATPSPAAVATRNVVVSFPDEAPSSAPASSPQRAGPEDDDLARTNPWAVPNVDDMWTGEGDFDPPSQPLIPLEASSPALPVALKRRSQGSR